MQIISNLYHNYPDQRILLVTHSNQALNQLFEKIMDLDIDPRHILRLGHGMEDIDSESSMGKYGRVNSFLERRIELLGYVDALAVSLRISGAHGNSCETAGYFYSYHIQSLWKRFKTVTASVANPVTIAQQFPFSEFFAHAPQPLFPSNSSLEETVEIAESCYRYIRNIFEQLEQVRAFELLRTNQDRSNYLLVKEAKIVALTCTHAAIKRRELISLGFKYDSVVMEEAAQILEIETVIPLLLQSAHHGTGDTSLKRLVMIGDHYQLPPVVQNSAFQRFSNLEQSLFTRLIRLGVPTIQLEKQGRCRPSLADLFRWRYTSLGDLGVTKEDDLDFEYGNPGFSFEYQVVNVDDYQGKGETEPMPHFIQNLGEAEYVVAVYQYMRLQG